MEDDAWIRAFLEQAPHGVLATVTDGQPFLNSNLFVYNAERHVIYMHTARVGRTAATFQQPEAGEGLPVCFSTFQMGRLLPAKEALEFSVEYQGVTVFGKGRAVLDEMEARDALQQLLDKYAPHLRPGVHYRPTTAEELKRTAVYRIQIENWAGKKKEVAQDFPGAFYYPIEGHNEAVAVSMDDASPNAEALTDQA
jgi:nitroimidazol reductase NimA-like FMN-containing flavoprotein (pyridoxamine 5'-phosphate oxidase superfamily)